MKNKKLKNIINLIILFLSAEVIKNFLSGMPDLKSLDIRMIFILIVSNYLGMKYGVVSAILASISYIVQEYGQIHDVNVIFLNTNNWVPIIIYIVFSIIVGLKTDKDNLKVASLENEIKQRSDREIEENEKIMRYEKEIKELNQILMVHNSSYIQASQFIKQLDKSRNNIKSINILLRKFLKNDSCEFLTMEELNMKSSNLIDDNKINMMKKEKIWINKELKDSLPFYIAPVIINQEDKMFIAVWKCEFEQMTTEYKNQIIGISEIAKYVLYFREGNC